MGRIVLAFQCFFAVLFGKVLPAKALPALPGGLTPAEQELQYKLKDAEQDKTKAEKALADALAAKSEAEQGGAKAAQTQTELEAAKAEAEARAKQAEQEVGELRQAQAALETEKGELVKRADAAEQAKSALETARAEAEETLANLEKRAGEAKAGAKEAEGKLKQARDEGALALLAWLQREGRLVDFLMESIDDYEDEQIGAAVRAIHSGCRKVIDEGLSLEPILPGEDESQVEVPKGFDPVAIQLSGNVKGEPPYTGTLVHHGWRTSKVDVPVSETVDASVLAPAEVEL